MRHVWRALLWPMRYLIRCLREAPEMEANYWTAHLNEKKEP